MSALVWRKFGGKYACIFPPKSPKLKSLIVFAYLKGSSICHNLTRKQLPIGFSVRCARVSADASCPLRARLYLPLWCCALVQDPHDTAGGHYPPRIRRVGPAGSLFQLVICTRCDKSFLSLSLFFCRVGGWKAKSRAGGASLRPKACPVAFALPCSSPQLC